MVLWMASLKMVSGRLPVRSPMFGVRRVICFGNRMKMLRAREIPAHLNTTTAPIFPTPAKELDGFIAPAAAICFVSAATCSSSRFKHFKFRPLQEKGRVRTAKHWLGGVPFRPAVASKPKAAYETELFHLSQRVLVHLCIWSGVAVAGLAAAICLGS